jgi:DNA-binding transcriptional ArsR family regulator
MTVKPPTRPPDIFAALANPVRREMLIALSRGARIASDLCAGPAVARSTASEHLQALRAAGLVVVERRGRELYYRLDPRPLTEVGAWLNVMLASWTRRLDDLQALKERGAS